VDEDDGAKGIGNGRRKHDPTQPLRDFTYTGISVMCKVPRDDPKLHQKPVAPCKVTSNKKASTWLPDSFRTDFSQPFYIYTPLPNQCIFSCWGVTCYIAFHRSYTLLQESYKIACRRCSVSDPLLRQCIQGGHRRSALPLCAD
jgi:hypothetical protein